MGNLVPCCSLTPRMCAATAKAVRVIVPGGGIRQFWEPVKAAELMLEHPGYFLINSTSMNVGRRFSALSADEDLEMGNAYGMFPLRRVNSVVTAADMAVLLEMAAPDSTAKRIVVRVSPENGSSEVEAAPSALDLVFEGFAEQEMKYRLSSSRSKRPLLETIVEESGLHHHLNFPITHFLINQRTLVQVVHGAYFKDKDDDLIITSLSMGGGGKEGGGGEGGGAKGGVSGGVGSKGGGTSGGVAKAGGNGPAVVVAPGGGERGPGMMVAPGGKGEQIPREAFESNPKGYFAGLHAAQKEG
nr:DUF4228 domain-containing protein [Ipomoea batatas]